MEEEPAYRVSVNQLGPGTDLPTSPLIQAISETLRRHHVADAEISVAMVDDAAMARLHQEYLGKSGSTDVITFDLSDKISGTDVEDVEVSPGGPARRKRVEGEIVLSVETAARESASRGHDVVREVALYAVHGVLHLLGFDDHRSSDADKMHAEEDAILSELGFGAVYGAGIK